MLFVRNMDRPYIDKIIKNEEWYSSNISENESNKRSKTKKQESIKLTNWLKHLEVDSCNIAFVLEPIHLTTLDDFINNLSGPYHIEQYFEIRDKSSSKAVYFYTQEDMVLSRLLADTYYVNDVKA